MRSVSSARRRSASSIGLPPCGLRLAPHTFSVEIGLALGRLQRGLARCVCFRGGSLAFGGDRVLARGLPAGVLEPTIGTARQSHDRCGDGESPCCGRLLGIGYPSRRQRLGRPLGCLGLTLDLAFGGSVRANSIGRSWVTDCGRSEYRTLRQASMAARKPGRYVPFAAWAAERMRSWSTRNATSSGGRPATAR